MVFLLCCNSVLAPEGSSFWWRGWCRWLVFLSGLCCARHVTFLLRHCCRRDSVAMESRGTEPADAQAPRHCLGGRGAMPCQAPALQMPFPPCPWEEQLHGTQRFTPLKKPFLWSLPAMELFLCRESCWHPQQSPWHVVLFAHTRVVV